VKEAVLTEGFRWFNKTIVPTGAAFYFSVRVKSFLDSFVVENGDGGKKRWRRALE
jgi:hypothetical protein